LVSLLCTFGAQPQFWMHSGVSIITSISTVCCWMRGSVVPLQARRQSIAAQRKP